MNLAAKRRYLGEKDPSCPSCRGTGKTLQCDIQARFPPLKVQCVHCFEDHNRCSTCGGDSMRCYGIHD